MRIVLLVTLLALSSGTFADDGYAKKLFEARCTSCHQLPDPMMLNAKQWGIVLQTMQQRMQHKKMAPLNEEEIKLIHGYLVSQIE